MIQLETMRHLFFSFFLLITLLQPVSAADCDALRPTFEKWVAAYANRDLAGAISIFEDDLIFSFQGAADANKADMEKGYRDDFAKPGQAKWVPKVEEFYCSGGLGFVRSTWRLEITNADGKTDVKAENRSVDILRRSEDGEWKIFRSLNYPVAAPKK
jgi:uncharacterized protein (TIGR02246 family)